MEGEKRGTVRGSWAWGVGRGSGKDLIISDV